MDVVDLGVQTHDPADISGEESESGFVSRLRQIIETQGSASALARRAGISQSGLHRYLSGGEPTRRALVSLAKAGGVDINWLATGNAPVAKGAENDFSTLARVAVYAEATDTGLPTRKVMTEVAFCREWLGDNGFDVANLLTASAKGDSMEPTLRDHDDVLIDTSDHVIDGGGIYALHDDHRFFLRRVQHQIGGKLRITCDNSAYPAVEVDAETISLIGRVVWRGSLL